MKLMSIALCALLACTGSASAEGFPVRARDGKVAPYGYTRSGDFYVPTSRDSRATIPKRSGETCPYGFSSSGGACLSKR